jgi:CTP:molybdopterin cytidylyltransferase MocA
MSRTGRAGRAFLSGVVLAAGASARMGRPKTLLPFAGRPLLQHAVDAVAGSRLDELVLVLGAEAEAVRAALALPRALRVVALADASAGLSASLRAGLAAADPRADAGAVLLGDQPGVDAALVDRVADAFLAGGRPAARPFFRDARGRRVPGHPVLLARRLWP